ncbi:hypothetical protein GCM10022198_16800 [Klugiella xanthotipulae]|uniref:Ig-like domain-containing protein n=1 Tax=Klugiella xanthotipulae TaxID=244735 RepID=A0A543HHE8_9MICO|nr:immunoglobulin domain-containing protein [Klugiella xanthotipulae]TQM57717.1 Ig-like domain-containing protein [Klugiella xanthotipulae]
MTHVSQRSGPPAGLFHHGKRTLAHLVATALTVGGLTVGIGTAAHAETAPEAVAETVAPVTRDLSFDSQRVQGIPGQYQIAHSDRSDSLYVTGSSGRPPIITGTLAKVDPETLTIEAVADLPVIPHSSGATAGFKRLSNHGVYADDKNGTVWVTNTRDNQVSVYDQDTLKQLWSSYEKNATRDPETGATTVAVEVNHPREVIIDEERGFAYVSAALRGTGDRVAVTVYNTTTFEHVTDIDIPDRVDYPAAGESVYPVTMGFDIDPASGTLYASDFQTDEVYVIDLATQTLQKRIPLNNPNIAQGTRTLQSSSVAINATLGELYTANQGAGGSGWSGLGVYDLTTGAFKYNIQTGSRALAVAADTEKNLIYVADFADGTVTVVDALSRGVIETITVSARSANHIIVANGSAYVVDKSGDFTGVEIPWGLDFLTGNVGTSATEVKGYTGTPPVLADPTPITADGITKITPGTSVPHVYVQNTTSIVPGGEVVLSGSGFAPGQQLAVKIDGDAFGLVGGGEGEAGSETTRGRIQADASGSFTGEKVTVPAETLVGTKAITPGEHTVSLLDSSPVTSVQATFVTATAATCEATPLAPVESTREDGDGAVLRTPAEVVVGQPIVLSGTGFKVTAGTSGPVFINQPTGGIGPVNVANRTIENQIPGSTYSDARAQGVWQADASGNWNLSIPFPTPANSTIPAGFEWRAGQTQTLRVLTGSLAAGDTIRSIEATFRVVDTLSTAVDPDCVAVAPTTPAVYAAGTSSPSPQTFAGYPELGAQYRAPTITASPVSVSVPTGDSATFTASASGIPAPTVQWQSSSNGTVWSDIPGATQVTLTVEKAEKLASGTRYRAVFSNLKGEATSEVATLLVSVPEPTEHEGAEAVAATTEELLPRGAGELTVVQTGSTVTVGNIPLADGEWVWAYGYSAATARGAHPVLDGATTVDVSGFAGGEHHLALYDGANLLGYVPFVVAQEAAAVEAAMVEAGSVDSGVAGSSGGAQLTNTGAEDAGLAWFAALVLVAGAGLVLRGRRRAADASA